MGERVQDQCMRIAWQKQNSQTKPVLKVFFVFKVCAQFENALHCDDMWICEDANESLGSVICMQRALPSSIVVVVMVPLRGCVRLIYFFFLFSVGLCDWRNKKWNCFLYWRTQHRTFTMNDEHKHTHHWGAQTIGGDARSTPSANDDTKDLVKKELEIARRARLFLGFMQHNWCRERTPIPRLSRLCNADNWRKKISFSR